MLKISGEGAAQLQSRLKSWRIHDQNGMLADTVELVIHADGLAVKIEEGTAYRFSLLGVNRGRYFVTRASLDMQHQLTLQLTSSMYNTSDTSGLRTKASATYTQQSLGTLVHDVGITHGFEVKVHPALSSIVVKHIDRTDEAALAFLIRIGQRFDALVKVRDKTLFFSPKGQAKSLTGKTVETLKLKRTEVKSGSLDLMGHTDFNGAQATYYDAQQGKQEHVYVGRAPFKKITGNQASQAAAQDIAQAELETLQRKKKRLKLVCTLQPTAFAECLIELDTSF